jgi:hypothetical protein
LYKRKEKQKIEQSPKGNFIIVARDYERSELSPGNVGSKAAFRE